MSSLERFSLVTEVVSIDRGRNRKWGLMSGKKMTGKHLKDYHGYKHLSSDATHDYYEKHHTRGQERSHDSSNYIAHNKATKQIDIHVSGKKNRAGTFHIHTLSAAKDSGKKAHDFYHHLIRKHNIALSTDKQSTGGRNVWEKLRKKRGINIHGWDPKTKKPVNVHSGDDEAYHHEKSKDKSDGSKRLHLIAHKR